MGPSCPMRDGLTPPSAPPPAWGKTYAISKAIEFPAWKKIFVLRRQPCFELVQTCGDFFLKNCLCVSAYICIYTIKFVIYTYITFCLGRGLIVRSV